MLSTFLPQGLCTPHSFVSNAVLWSPLTHWISAQKCLLLSNAKYAHVPRCTPSIGSSHCASQTITMSACPPEHCLAAWPEHKLHQCRKPLFKSPGTSMIPDSQVCCSLKKKKKKKDSEQVPWNTVSSRPSQHLSSVAQSCPTLCNPMDCSTPGLPVHHQLPEFTQTHVHQLSAAIQPSQPLSSPSPPAVNLSQNRGLF